MQSHRLLYGTVLAEALTAARAAAVQAGWSAAEKGIITQLRRAQGKGRTVSLRLTITATGTRLDINIDGSFG